MFISYEVSSCVCVKRIKFCNVLNYLGPSFLGCTCQVVNKIFWSHQSTDFAILKHNISEREGCPEKKAVKTFYLQKPKKHCILSLFIASIIIVIYCLFIFIYFWILLLAKITCFAEGCSHTWRTCAIFLHFCLIGGDRVNKQQKVRANSGEVTGNTSAYN